ncbi:M1 family aminopeptidase [Singulisphaera acidiphila]|uniref:Aminopeptidase N n=1 Tax=Singulisphaera acidiphila (strain ATCC BAA-1392 / DSM 18658 / VKM B-2454 / MOB10) TaxID=886293 RepID=L0D8P1_SINAD|nr:M1 family aminopeptidase [Singulisphaera acidiphila]AGA25769.1 aminopeptidase N [Singulisphaera acidiphila DSM 18658]
MRFRWQWTACLIVGLFPWPERPVAAGEVPVRASTQRARLTIPAGLPRYEIDASLDLSRKLVTARERVRFTNRSAVATRELVFHVYPRYKMKEEDRPALSKTLEVLRLSPEESMDAEGRRINIDRVQVGGQSAPFTFDPDVDTVMIVPLARPVGPGEMIVAEIDFNVELPDIWGRWGHHHGLTYLLNWYPVLAHHDDQGWERTPYVPWHQPWHQEAGHYTVRFDSPEGQVIASSGRITDRKPGAPGRQVSTIVASPARDFALVCSDRFEVREQQVGPTLLRVVSLPEHKANAEKVLEYAAEVLPLYERWFGPYFDDEFEIAPSFFGWNGNECSGLVLLDDRVMRVPSSGERYIDHLVTHETCHQWFWNVVGTDGYAETFMDEGLVNAFTAIRLDEKYGRNAPLINWGKGLTWLPTIGREDLRLSGYYGWRARGNNGPVIQDIKSMGNLNALFSLAYDRGGKVIEMIKNRLGDERFFAFFRKIYHEYAFETFHYADLKRELTAFDPSFDWNQFLDGWLVEHKDTDWAVEHVKVDAASDNNTGVRSVTVELKQSGEMIEPTVVLCRCGPDEIRVPIWPDRGSYDIPGAHVAHVPKEDRWVVTVQAPSAPSQVIVDPDHALLDSVPDNNRWKPEIAWRFTPFMTPLDESSQFQSYDRTSIVAGPFIDQYARGGFKIGAQRVNRWQATVWAGAEPALREAIFGGQFALVQFPWPHWSLGVFYEEGLYNFYNDKRHSGGRAFLRYRFLETSSFLIDDQGFAELYFGTGNEFWQGDDGRPVNGKLNAVGGRYRLSTLFPYWDPVQGFEIDATAEYGDRSFGSAATYVRIAGEFGVVRPIPTWSGEPSKSRIAVRVYGGYGGPDTVPLFRLGGGRRLRALDLSQDIGSSVWLSTFEWRFPIWRDIDQDLVDHILSVRNLLGAVFYDVGQSYLRGEWNPVVHGVGVGIRVDAILFAFLERASLRIDIAQPVGVGPGRSPVLWFGLNQVF